MLNINGLPESSGGIWLGKGLYYKAVVKDANGVTIATIDNFNGINDVNVNVTLSEWTLFGFPATYNNYHAFTVAGDQTQTFKQWRRLRAAVSAGTWYGTIVSSAFGAGVTTVEVKSDNIDLDSGLSQVYYGTLSPQPSSIPRNIPFPPGTVVIFSQAAAPVGWVQVTDDRATDRYLRVVSDGSSGDTGGAASPGAGVTVAPAHTHSFSVMTGAADAAHQHLITNLSLGIGAPGAIQTGTGESQTYEGTTDFAVATHDHAVAGDTASNAGGAATVFRFVNVIACMYVG
jgi:hypothetical protein